MDLENRISLLAELGEYMQSSDQAWTAAKTRSFQHNPWFIPDFIDLAIRQITDQFLQRSLLEKWAAAYDFSDENKKPKNVGVVMAGNIPLVGFHDFLSCFLSGHRQFIKLSSKDSWLFPALLNFMNRKDDSCSDLIQQSDMLKDMDAYIATGSNNSARYFDYYFGKYPSLIRRNRTSVAVLEGNETKDELEKLADDVFLYFGLGCRNVTQVLVPENYDFVPLLQAFRKYQWMADHNKYKNNYDYRLSLSILNKQLYMTNDYVLLLENESPFSPISVVHYAFYKHASPAIPPGEKETLQCVVGRNFLAFGTSQKPGLTDYADGQDSLKFLQSI
jgi:hypothetical protein